MRHFLDFLIEAEDNFFEDAEPFVFVPTELDFEFSLLDADLSPDGEGEVTARVMIRVDDQAKPAYVGSTFSVEASQVRRFLNALEIEIVQIAHPQVSSVFVAATV